MSGNYNHTFEFDKNFNEDLNDEIICLLKNFNTVNFNDNFNRSINEIPNNIETIYFGKSFNQPIDFLPHSVKYIFFDDFSEFNQKINNLPTSVIYIKFGEKFNQEVNHLPDELEDIFFGVDFNQSIDDLPDAVENITFHPDSNFTQTINKLPYYITNIFLLSEYYKIDGQVIEEFPYLNIYGITDHVTIFYNEHNKNIKKKKIKCYTCHEKCNLWYDGDKHTFYSRDKNIMTNYYEYFSPNPGYRYCCRFCRHGGETEIKYKN